MTTVQATLDVRKLMEAAIDAAAEKRGIDIGICLAAAILVRDFDRPSFAVEILEASGIDADRLAALDLDDYDTEPLQKVLGTPSAEAADA